MGLLLRRSTPLVAAALALAALSPAAAPAKQKGGGYRHFDAVETGSSVITSAGPVLKVTGDAVIRGKLIGKGTLHLDLTVTPAPVGDWKAVGRFTITAANGDTLTGTSRGSLKVTGQVNAVDFRSKVRGGTGRFAGARGWLVSRGTTTIVEIDAAGAIHTSDEATCKGLIRLAKKRGGRNRH